MSEALELGQNQQLIYPIKLSFINCLQSILHRHAQRPLTKKDVFFLNCLLSPLVTLKNIVLQHEFCKHSPRKQQRLSVYKEINTVNISATVLWIVLYLLSWWCIHRSPRAARNKQKQVKSICVYVCIWTSGEEGWWHLYSFENFPLIG